ncbi:MAG: hypothetical protein GF346_00880, partial [Candidatus Eisenbacteria bacterium]|nr:hypothetical protein [Candidatus Latescibacterota bacterium]MBD3300986.1 hypothetical protein [Candidatus Eisenbacteria bacterium]
MPSFRPPTPRLIGAALVLVVTLIALRLLYPEPAPSQDPDDRLGIDLVAPRGEVAAVPSIDVVFDAQMVPLGEKEEGLDPPPLRLTPEIEGSFTWIGTRALSFVPARPVPEGTRIACVVPAETRSLSGARLGADHRFEIIVGRPRLLRAVPDDWGLIAPDATLHVAFTLPPAEDAVRFVSLAGPGGAI